MAIFKFRLQTVLEYREMQESWAKDAYLDARAARVSAEDIVLAIRTKRGEMIESTPSEINARRNLEWMLIRLDDQERDQNHVVSVLGVEEMNALAAWQNQKRDLETLVKLRDNELAEWNLEENRREQRELDEWAVMRHSA